MARVRTACKDCVAEGVTTKRRAPHPGPRCASHHRALKSKRKNVSWETHLMTTYGITTEQYWTLYAYQGGLCNICRRAKGTGRRKLAVDHDHATGEIRQLLCLRCNRHVLGHLRDDSDALRRAADSIDNPPARDAIGRCFVPSTSEE